MRLLLSTQDEGQDFKFTAKSHPDKCFRSVSDKSPLRHTAETPGGPP